MEKFISEIRNTADKVAKKSGELVEMSKVKLGIVSKKSELGTNFKILGELVYMAQKNNDNSNSAKIEEIIAKIDDLYEKLGELADVSAALKNEKVCAYCGKNNPIGQAFCGGCGQKFPDDEEPAQEGEVIDDITEVETV